MNPQPLIIRTQGHNNKKFGKMNLYEAFQQALFVPQKKEQNWYLTSGDIANLEMEGSGSQTVVDDERRERAPKMKIENENFFFFFSPNLPNFQIKI